MVIISLNMAAWLSKVVRQVKKITRESSTSFFHFFLKKSIELGVACLSAFVRICTHLSAPRTHKCVTFQSLNAIWSNFSLVGKWLFQNFLHKSGIFCEKQPRAIPSNTVFFKHYLIVLRTLRFPPVIFEPISNKKK